MKEVYHFTCPARLPWILKSGELRAGENNVGGFPDPDFLWATSASVGDKTASAYHSGYHDGFAPLVRFTLSEADFEPWSEMPAKYPAWTPSEVRRLENGIKGMDPS